MLSNKILQIKNIRDYDGLRYYDNAAGKFCFFNPKIGLISGIRECRIEFGWIMRKNRNFIGFIKNKINIESLNRFWSHIENKLNIYPKTIFHKTNEDNIIVLEISPFWSENITNKNFFTLFLRCGAIHYDGNFNDAI